MIRFKLDGMEIEMDVEDFLRIGGFDKVVKVAPESEWRKEKIEEDFQEHFDLDRDLVSSLPKSWMKKEKVQKKSCQPKKRPRQRNKKGQFSKR